MTMEDVLWQMWKGHDVISVQKPEGFFYRMYEKFLRWTDPTIKEREVVYYLLLARHSFYKSLAKDENLTEVWVILNLLVLRMQSLLRRLLGKIK